MEKIIRIGTRGSKLALVQTEMVIDRLVKKYPEWRIETVIIHTKGDKILDKPLVDFGGKGAFVTEFEEALADGRIDLAIHSSKDMPVKLYKGLTIAGVLPRADVRDVLITRKGLLSQINNKNCKEFANITIGTGSLRRQFQLKEIFPSIKCVSIRGNVPTRLQKIRTGECDSVVLAAAGLSRLGLLEEEDFEYRYFSTDEMIPAGGQGIIAVEGRIKDKITEMVKSISDEKAYLELETERSILNKLNVGCHEPFGVISRVEDERITIKLIRERNGRVEKLEGSDLVSNRLELAEKMLSRLQNED